MYNIDGGDTVTLSYEECKNMKSNIELLEILAEADDDVKMIGLHLLLKHLMTCVKYFCRADYEIYGNAN